MPGHQGVYARLRRAMAGHDGERYPALRRAPPFALSRVVSFAATLAALPCPLPAIGSSISRWPAAVFFAFLPAPFAAFGSAVAALPFAGARLPLSTERRSASIRLITLRGASAA